jgi:hypothetical protein
MDMLDKAQQNIDDLTEYTIKNIRAQTKSSLIFSGFCYYCDETVHSPHIFCDLDCRDDWEREKRLKQIAGR